MPDVDGMHSGRAVREQDVGEAACRGSHVERDASKRVKGEHGKAVRELQPAATDPGVIRAIQAQGDIIEHLITWFRDPPVAAHDPTSEDE